MEVYYNVLPVIIILIFTQETLQQDCRSINRQPGKCVSIQLCPPLLDVLKNRPTPYLLRQLQRLTCGFDAVDPKVCCPLREIITTTPSPTTTTTTKVPPLTADQRLGGGSSPHDLGVDRGQGSISPGTDLDPGFPSQTQIKGSNNGGNGIPFDLRSHPAFPQIPSLKDCGVGFTENRIIGGKNVSHGTYPWIARIGYKNPSSERIDYFCGGTIISKRYILTAAHCTEGAEEDYAPVSVRLGEHNTETETDCNDNLQQCSVVQDIKIDKVLAHPQYSPTSKQNDISLIRLASDIQLSLFIKPVCLPFLKEYSLNETTFPDNPDPIKKGIVVGFGRTQWNKADGSTVLQEVNLPIKTNEGCQSIYRRRVTISNSQLCAGGEAGQDSCAGDSGGPLLIPSRIDKGLRIFQLGIVSFGPVQCGVGGLPGVYARTSSYLKWILDTISETS